MHIYYEDDDFIELFNVLLPVKIRKPSIRKELCEKQKVMHENFAQNKYSTSTKSNLKNKCYCIKLLKWMAYFDRCFDRKSFSDSMASFSSA